MLKMYHVYNNRLAQHLKPHSTMLVNAMSLVGTTVITSVLGFVYWWVAARFFSPQAVGLASAAISAMMLLGSFGVVGLGTLLVGELPRQPGHVSSLLSAALILVAAVAGSLGVVFALTSPLLAPSFRSLNADPSSVLLFAGGVGLTAMTLVLDQALVGLLRGELQLWRNLLFALLKLAALFVAALWLTRPPGLAIYTTWTIGNLLSLGVLAVLALGQGRWSQLACRPHWGLLRKLGPAALWHHALNLALQAPILILPVMVTALLSATANAWFFISLGIANLTSAFTAALTTVLYAESSARPAVFRQKIRFTLGLALLASVLSCAILCLAARQILGLFGGSYAIGAQWCLPILALEAFPLLIRNHYIAVCRIHGRMSRAMYLILAVGTLQLTGAALGAHLAGLNGLCLGWLLADCFGTLFMVPTVYQAAIAIHDSICPPRHLSPTLVAPPQKQEEHLC